MRCVVEKEDKMPAKTKPKRTIRGPRFSPDSFTRAELRIALDKVFAARKQKKKSVVESKQK